MYDSSSVRKTEINDLQIERDRMFSTLIYTIERII